MLTNGSTQEKKKKRIKKKNNTEKKKKKKEKKKKERWFVSEKCRWYFVAKKLSCDHRFLQE